MSRWWTILGVDQRATQRDIKRAYAAQLKKTRPDEDPAGFQILHEAYKLGLAIASAQGGQTHKNPDVTREDDDWPRELTNTEFFHPVATSDFLPSEQEHHRLEETSDLPAVRETESFEARVADILASQTLTQESESWRFLTECGDLLDDNFRRLLGLRVLELIFQFDRGFNSSRIQNVAIPNHLLAELDAAFLWSLDVNAYVEKVDVEKLQRIIERAESGRLTQVFAPVGGQIVNTQDARRDRETMISKIIVFLALIAAFLAFCHPI